MKLIGVLVFICLIIACTSRPVEPTRSSRHAIDTIYHRQVLVLEPSMDSLCAIIAKEIYDAAVDSIMHVREMEMNILIE